MRLAAGVTRGALVAELAAVLGAPHEARFIVDEARAGALGTGRSPVQATAPSGALDDDVVAAARAMATRRAAGEPLQYIFGHWPFRSIDLLVDPRVLIPRPETEQVVEVALREARRLHGAARNGRTRRRRWRDGNGRHRTVAGGRARAGRGARSLGHRRQRGRVGGRRGEPRARLQATFAGVMPPVELVAGSWLEPLPARLRGAITLVVSNPPYVSAAEWPDLEAEVRTEPRAALVAGPASDSTPGLADVEAVLAQSSDWLGTPGAVVVELAPHQAASARALAVRLGYADAQVLPDLAGRPWALLART